MGDWCIVEKIKSVTVQTPEENSECCLMEQADYTRPIFRKPEDFCRELRQVKFETTLSADLFRF